jgi:hypothetical protein
MSAMLGRLDAEPLLDVQFHPPLRGRQEVEQVRVAGGLLGEVGVGLRQRRREVADRIARALVQAPLDVQRQHVAAPALVDRLGGVPESQLGLLDLFDQRDLVPPGKLCNAALHNLPIGPCLGERPHVLEVAWRVAASIREPIA